MVIKSHAFVSGGYKDSRITAHTHTATHIGAELHIIPSSIFNFLMMPRSTIHIIIVLISTE